MNTNWSQLLKLNMQIKYYVFYLQIKYYVFLKIRSTCVAVYLRQIRHWSGVGADLPPQLTLKEGGWVGKIIALLMPSISTWSTHVTCGGKSEFS